MGSFREHCGVEVQDWGILRMLARCAEAMGHGEMDVLHVVLRKEILKDLRQEIAVTDATPDSP